MDNPINPEIQKIFAKRESRRKALAAQAFPLKIRDLVKIQTMIAPIERLKGKSVRIWKLD